jgi:lambda family phage minor tail protein L
MPLRDTPLTILAEKNQLASSGQWIWLYEIDVPTEPPTRYRLTRTPQAVDYGGYSYSPFPLSHETIVRDSDGDMPTTTLTASNVSRELIATLENYEGLVGQRVAIILTHSLLVGASSTSHPVVEEVFTVISSSATAEAVTLTLGSSNLYDTAVPKARMMRYHCRHQYRSAECGYSLPSASANYLSGCDKTLDGPNGCTAHGASYTSEGLTPLHPERFGGFPGLPTEHTGGGI